VVPLIGTATASEAYQPTKVAALKGSAKSVVIPTHEWWGNTDERLDFPSNWEINVQEPGGYNAPALTPRQIAQDLSKTIGTRPLRDLAAGRQTAVVTFDDITRGTPAWAVAPWVVSELKAAGIDDDHILFLCAVGSHRMNFREDFRKKLGKDIVTRYAHQVHNCYINLKKLGVSSFKTPIAINQTFMEADLKLCISGLKVHERAGYGGGPKAILPGVASFETIVYNHNVVIADNLSARPLKVFKNVMQRDLIEAARMAKVDFTIQVVYNKKLQPSHVFSGDVVEAHHAAVRVAARHWGTPVFKNADIVVANGYPLDLQAGHAQGWIERSVKEGGTGVLIIQHPLLVDYIQGWSNNNAGRDGSGYFSLLERRIGLGGPQLDVGTGGPKSGLIVYSQYMDKTLMNAYPKDTLFATRWEEVIKILLERHKGDARVAVYPCADNQHEQAELDG
jgi:nickel-dependent lactate racemase